MNPQSTFLGFWSLAQVLHFCIVHRSPPLLPTVPQQPTPTPANRSRAAARATDMSANVACAARCSRPEYCQRWHARCGGFQAAGLFGEAFAETKVVEPGTWHELTFRNAQLKHFKVILNADHTKLRKCRQQILSSAFGNLMTSSREFPGSIGPWRL